VDLQFDVESEPRDTLAATVKGSVKRMDSHIVWSW